MDLTQAKAVITGGASGLGFATAERIIAAGGKVVLITNAPRPSASLHEQFETIGVPHDIYDHLVSSGDVTRVELERFGGGGKLIVDTLR